MRAVIQRVSRAQVTVNDELTGKITRGLLVLVGVAHADTEADAGFLVEKIAGLRLFAVHALRRCARRQASILRCRRPSSTRSRPLRIFCRAHPVSRAPLRNR